MFLGVAKVEGPKQTCGYQGWSGLGPMNDFCTHFGVPAARPGGQKGASVGQGRSKLAQRVHQMSRFARNGAPGPNNRIYDVFKLLGWALEGIGRLKDTVEGPMRGQ